jgi:hypothetical protein
MLFRPRGLAELLREAGFGAVRVEPAREVWRYMVEQSQAIRATRLAASGAAPSGDAGGESLEQFTARAHRIVAQDPARSEFITLTASP